MKHWLMQHIDLNTHFCSTGQTTNLQAHLKQHGVNESSSTPAQKQTKQALLTTRVAPLQPLPPKCCYFVAVGGLACLEDPWGYASWSLTPGRINHAGQAQK